MKLEYILGAAVLVFLLLIEVKPFGKKEQVEPVERIVAKIADPIQNRRTFPTAEYRGKVVLLVFWATWCGPCMRELPELKKVYEDFHHKGFEIVAVSLDEDLEAVRRFKEQEGIKWLQMADGQGFQGDLAREYQVGGVPAHFLYGRDGNLLDRNLVYGNSLYRTVEREVNKENGKG